MPLRETRDAGGRLAHRGLGVETALTGHDNVRRADFFLQPRLLHHDFNARHERCAEEGAQSEAHAARRAGAREIRVALGVYSLCARGKGLQPAVHSADTLCIGALLRAEYGAAPERAAQRVLHIARRAECAVPQFRQRVRRTDTVQIREAGRAARDRRAAFVEQVKAERLQHAGAAVVRRTAAKADHKPAAAAGDRIADHLAHTERRRFHRVARLRRYLRQTRRPRHLHDGETARNAVPAGDRRTERAGH